MDSEIALAIMAKAKLVFEREETFLSFPLTTVAFSKQHLSFVIGDYQSVQGMFFLCEFSRLVNLVPSGIIWPPLDERYLWDVYDEILKSAKLASSERTAEEETEYQKAWHFLHEEEEEGLPGPTPAVIAYQQCKDAWIAAMEDYKNAEYTAELSSDPSASQKWREVDEPALRKKVNVAENRWINEGNKTKVEEARRIEASLGAKSTHKTWAEWAERFNKDIDFKTDPISNLSFVPTIFSPANALEIDSWQRFTMKGDEADALVGKAPEELRSRLASDHVDLDIESLSFEFCSAVLIRPWLVPDVFAARFWRFSESSKILSDGKMPPTGICPAYVAAVVFARNLEVKPRADSSRNVAALNRLAGGGSLSLGFFRVAPAATAKVASVVDAVRKPPILTLAPLSKSALFSTPTTKHLESQPLLSDKQISHFGRAVGGSTLIPDKLSVTSPTRAKLTNMSPRILSRMRDFAFIRSPSSPQASTATSISPVDPKSSGTGQDEIYIAAFICKVLPRCPNPDSSFVW